MPVRRPPLPSVLHLSCSARPQIWQTIAAKGVTGLLLLTKTVEADRLQEVGRHL